MAHGGQIVVFGVARDAVNYSRGRLRFRGDLEVISDPFELDNWSFLSIFDEDVLGITFDRGSEMSPINTELRLSSLLSRHLPGSTFSCIIGPKHPRDQANWYGLLKSKYGATAAGLSYDEESRGGVLILPDMGDKAAVACALVAETLPALNPDLFPEFEGSRWVHRPEYELPRVLELDAEMRDVKAKADKTIEEINRAIVAERDQNQDWYTLLRGTGRELVEAVIRTLAKLGFEKIVDVDIEEKEPSGGPRKDIQIHDRSPVLVIDVKGVQGHPEDGEATQSEKHALMRVHEWNRADVKALTIINHQRNLPPYERDQQAYRKEIVNNAIRTRLGLMTTWDLWKICRNAQKLAWPNAKVMDIFYQVGRVDPIPGHYVSVGDVVTAWSHVFGVIPRCEIKVGARLAVEVGDTFEEFLVASLHVDNADVKSAQPGSNCGVALSDAAKKVREGARVFLVT